MGYFCYWSRLSQLVLIPSLAVWLPRSWPRQPWQAWLVVKSDIDACYEALKDAKYPQIHVFIATSPIHREFKLNKTKEEILEAIKEHVYAQNLRLWNSLPKTRTELDFLASRTDSQSMLAPYQHSWYSRFHDTSRVRCHFQILDWPSRQTARLSIPSSPWWPRYGGGE